MEKYCENCKYLRSYEGECGEFHHLCYAPLNIMTKKNVIHKYTTPTASPEFINKYNKCPYYKRVWFKFWIKEE